MNKKKHIPEINSNLDKIGEAIMTSLKYNFYPIKNLDAIIESIDHLISHNEYLEQIEKSFKSSGNESVLYFLSSILCNLKGKKNHVMTPDVMRWLGSVWKNFLKRNISYQEIIPSIDKYRNQLGEYYPPETNFVNQIENTHLVLADFIHDKDPTNSGLKALEKFYQSLSEILGWMRPTYFFLLDYYYERKLATGKYIQESYIFENRGLAEFGEKNYTYYDICYTACQTLGILEAIYLSLRKKKMPRKLTSINGKTKLMAAGDIYRAYLEKFNETKKELLELRQ